MDEIKKTMKDIRENINIRNLGKIQIEILEVNSSISQISMKCLTNRLECVENSVRNGKYNS
jgi:hypothetical protein